MALQLHVERDITGHRTSSAAPSLIRMRASWTPSRSKRKALRFFASSALQNDIKQKCDKVLRSGTGFPHRIPEQERRPRKACACKNLVEKVPIQKTPAASFEKEKTVEKCEQLTARLIARQHPYNRQPASQLLPTIPGVAGRTGTPDSVRSARSASVGHSVHVDREIVFMLQHACA